MKKTLLSAALAASCLVLPASSRADDEILPTEKRDGYGVFDGWYSQFDKHDLDLKGGGFHVGGEFVDPSLLLGIGGRIGMGMYFGSDNISRTGKYTSKIEDPMAMDLLADVYIPFRVSEFATIYGGVGATGFSEFADYTVTLYNGRRYTTVKGDLETDGFPVLFAAFAGVRIRYENFFGFVEYRREVKKDVTFKQSYDNYNWPDDEWKSKRGGGRLFIGLGVEFGK